MRFLVVSLLVASTAARSSLRLRELGGWNGTDVTKDVVNTDTADATSDIGNVENFENVESSEGVESVENVDNAESIEAMEGVDAGPVSSPFPKFFTSG